VKCDKVGARQLGRHPSCIRATVVRKWPRIVELVVAELTPDEALEKCHKHLVAGLRLIRPVERVRAIASAMQEVEAREKRRDRQRSPN
jgi:hypothetical protein